MNTGEVVVRPIKTGERQTEYTPIGHTVNLASRIQSVANAGAIVISDSTRNLVEGYFALRSMGLTRVKGINEPISVYEVTGLGPLRTRLGAISGPRPFQIRRSCSREGKPSAARRVAQDRVGPDRCHRCRARRRQVAALLRVQGGAQPGNWTVLEAFSVSHGKGSSYLPVIELLHGYFGIVKDDDPAIRRDKVAKRIADLDSIARDSTSLSLRAARNRGRQGASGGHGPAAQTVAHLRGCGSASA